MTQGDYLFIHNEINQILEHHNNAREFIQDLQSWSDDNKVQVYVIKAPLGENKYSYDFNNGFVVLSAKTNITFVDFGGENDSFDIYYDDFIEDLSAISDKYRYKQFIGRPRDWKVLTTKAVMFQRTYSANELMQENSVADINTQRKIQFLVSALIGSINNIAEIGITTPDNILDKIKNKIVLFDGTQTNFIFGKIDKKTIRIQGLSGTGKTELLLNKLKEVFVSEASNKVLFTCHNKILADKLRRRIPIFFDFMKVEKQISWHENLWCIHAWGSKSSPDSGTYSYICNYYGIPFEAYDNFTSFKDVCANAIKIIEDDDLIDQCGKAFDYIFIDESQDFPQEFFELCELVTEKRLIIAGDIFQSIFADVNIGTVDPDYLLKKCYRTDPRTLMAAHSIGMGLFEEVPLRWLSEEEWSNCGYLITKYQNDEIWALSREPLSRFEDIDYKTYSSIFIEKVEGVYSLGIVGKILDIVQKIKNENPTVKPDDIGIIVLDNVNRINSLIFQLEMDISDRFGWPVNKAYTEKRSIDGTLFVSNKNNVKGLEFPFVICISDNIKRVKSFRNGLYMSMTRSFLQTYLVLSKDVDDKALTDIQNGISKIVENGAIEVNINKITAGSYSPTINYNKQTLSLEEEIEELIQEYDVPELFANNLKETVRLLNQDLEFDRKVIRTDFVENYNKFLERQK